MSVIKIKRGLPYLHRFTASSVTNVALVGPDYEKTQTAPTIVTIANERRQTVITPGEYGQWTFQTSDGSNNTTHHQTFEVVPATDAELSIGCVNKHQELVDYWPSRLVTTSVSGLSVSAGTVDCYATSKKTPIPYDGYVYGVMIHGTNDILNLDSLRFFTLRWQDATSSLQVRGISEDIKDHTPEEGAWGVSNEWKTVMFEKPVFAQMGDRFGLEFNNTSNGASFTGFRMHVGSNTSKSVMRNIRKASAITVNSSNNFSALGAENVTIGCRPLMHPPVVAIGGHSFWAGGGSAQATAPPYADTATSPNYDPSVDIAPIVRDLLGVSVVNLAEGGSRLREIGSDGKGWIGSSGLAAQMLADARPAVMLFDTSYSDTNYNADTDINDELVVDALDRLLAMCDKYNCELVLVESPLPDINNGTASQTKHLRNIELYRRWAGRNGIAWIPTIWRLCRNADGDALSTTRSIYRPTEDGIDSYGDADTVHLSPEGRQAAAHALVQGFRNRRQIGPPTGVAVEDITKFAEADQQFVLSGGVYVMRLYERGTTTQLVPDKAVKQIDGTSALTDFSTQTFGGILEE